MKIEVIPDCEVTDPPSNGFVMLPETESDRAWMAEMVDLPMANRMAPHFAKNGIQLGETHKPMVDRARTSRIAVSALGTHLKDSPNSNDAYVSKVLETCVTNFGCDVAQLLARGFFVRTFWF